MSSAVNLAAGMPTLGRVFLTQLRLIPQRSGRGVQIALVVILLQLAVLAVGGIVFAIQIQISEAPESATNVLWTDIGQLAEGVDFPLDQGTAAVAFAFVVSLLWGLFAARIVWRDERPAGRGYHWVMPVERWLHDLLRTAAGGCWLVAVAAVQAAVAVLAATLAGHGELIFATFSFTAWLNLLLAPLVPYLLVSAAVVRSDRPWGWFFAVQGVAFALWTLAMKSGWVSVVGTYEFAIMSSPLGLLGVLAGPFYQDFLALQPIALSRWLGGLLLWLAIGATLVSWAARSRRHGL